MRGPLPRTWLGRVRVVLIAAELALFALAAGSSGAVAGLRERWDEMNRPPGSRGARIYQMACAGCHGGSDEGRITDMPPKHNASGHTWQHADCELFEVIRDGMTATVASGRPAGARVDPAGMPAYRGRLDDAEIHDVVAFIKTMWTEAQRASQREATAERCPAA